MYPDGKNSRQRVRRQGSLINVNEQYSFVTLRTSRMCLYLPSSIHGLRSSKLQTSRGEHVTLGNGGTSPALSMLIEDPDRFWQFHFRLWPF